MQSDARHQAAAKEWQKTSYANLIRYVPSGTYFARVRVAGKLIRRSLKTDVLTVAKLRLADLEVARWLGHKDGGALAMRTYGHLREEHSVNMARKVSFSALPRQTHTGSPSANGPRNPLVRE